MDPLHHNSITFPDWLTRRKGRNLPTRFGIFVVIVLLFIFVYYTQITINKANDIITNNVPNQVKINKYLIHTPTCRIPKNDPFNEDVRPFFHQQKYFKCSEKGMLTYLEKWGNFATLKVNKSLLPSYSTSEIKCCYSAVTRVVQPKKPDNYIRFSNCTSFKDSVNLTDFVVKVKCANIYNVEVYANVHSAIIFTESLKERLQVTQNYFSVLFVGIDSISKLNLMRTMPKTHKFLDANNFTPLDGYTKIDDNTFPNLMAILTGLTREQIYEKCDPLHSQLNNCDIIWDKFRSLGYVTAYAEDESKISTFNYLKMGFSAPPTDFYFRPYFLAAETLRLVIKSKMKYCTGPETAAERILNLAKDFSTTFSNYPKFSLWWMNSFSHNNINGPSSMDGKIERFLREIKTQLNNTIFIFFSDHGFRFGHVRYTYSGWLEERLPFIYISFPSTFKEQYSDKFNNFLVNTKRLTNPYDLHMTLQDILYLANSTYAVTPSGACPKCRSLFEEISENRSCEDAAIAQHWCVCKGYTYVKPDGKIVKKIVQFAVNEVNKLISSFTSEGKFCAYYYVKQVISAGITEVYFNKRNESVYYFLLLIETDPVAIFEATIETSFQLTEPVFRLSGDISRVNSYEENSRCVGDPYLKKYCYCSGFFSKIKSVICYLLHCY